MSKKQEKRQETCQRKKKYFDAASAKAKAALSAKSTGDDYHIYRCPVCPFWHIATNNEIYWRVQVERQAREIAADEIAALRVRADELGKVIAEDKRRTAEREDQQAAIIQQVRDLAGAQQTAKQIFGGGILAQIRARRRARKAKKLQQRRGR